MGNVLLTILYTVLIFGGIIFIHEFGHFITARLTGVKVIEFALGMGPAIWKHQGKRTLYSVRIFPIGGYCAMEGEDGQETEAEKEEGEEALPEALPEEVKPEEVKPEPPREETPSRRRKEEAINQKSIPQRMLVFAAGAIMNLILGYTILLCTLIGVPYYSSTVVADFKENATTVNSGLQAGDQIVKMNHTSIVGDKDIVFEILRDDDGKIDMEVIRNGERIKLPQVEFTVSGSGSERSIYLDFRVKAVPASFINAISQAGKDTFSLARNSWMSIGDLFTGRVGFKDLSGPVGVGQVVGQAAKIGFTNVLNLAAVISISIGMFNLLPFPALDGGKIVFLLIEAIRRKPINPKWEGYINAAGLILLFGLMIVVTLKDVLNLF